MTGRSADARNIDNLKANVGKLQQSAAELAEGLGVTLAEVPGPVASAVAAVVVVGEPKNGKSSLVNALVQHPGLSPVDYAIATATYIAIRHGAPGAAVFPEGRDDAEIVPIDELAAWTSVEGLAANPRAPKVPRPVEVTVDAPILERVTLIDTPGVGGFDGSHDRATLAALTGATSLLFCADGSRPLSEPELEFLAQATGAIARVAFVLTKVDQNPGWRDVLADDLARIAERAPAFADAPWFPVAAPLAERSVDPSLPVEARRTLRERSGIDAVADHLVGAVAGHLDELVAANTVKQIRLNGELLLERATERVRMLDDPSDDARRQLQSEQHELDRLASIEDTWRTDLELSLNTLRGAEINHLDRVMREIQALGEPLVKRKDVSAEELTSTVNGRLSTEAGAASARIVEGTDRQIRDIIGDAIESPAFAAAMEKALGSDEVVRLREGRDLVAEGRLQPAQTMPLIMTVSSGFMIANFTGLGGAFGAVTTAGLSFVPGLGLGVAAAATAVMFARRQSKQNERNQWLQTRLAEAKVDLQTVVEQRIASSKTLALRAVREWIRSRQSELRSSIAALNAQVQRDAAERQSAVQEAQARVDGVDALLRTCDNYLDRLVQEGIDV
ncbi:dynamin family protein [Dermatobacter hominis]|uniref:dynamin family protein n=1 Tax=Dermatobacter hominis TaxID=2884263 RepID=UPI001D105ABF|nr:dynamin family protein [Dermatobacter hominis]UDY35003.1 dynamin family protein [Dermatobacter hominis]